MNSSMKTMSSGWHEGFSMPQPAYADPAVFAADNRLLSEGLWLLIDHESAIPQKGDFITRKVGAEEIVILRDKNGKVKAFFNVCRHRGSRICLEEGGNAQALVCPYHGWTYGLDGALRGASLMPVDFDKRSVSLEHCNIRVEDGLIFLNTARVDVPDFEDFIAPFRPYLSLHGLQETKVAARKIYPTAANWKLLVENFFECYHCRTAHASYCKVHDPRKLLALGAGPKSGDAVLAEAYKPIFDRWLAQEHAAGRFAEIFSDDADDLHFRSAGRAPIGDGMLTESMDGRPVAPLIGNARERNAYDGAQTGMVFNPVSTLLVVSDHAVIFKFAAVDALHSMSEAIWLVHKDAREGIDYDVDALTALWDVTLKEDKTITENNQKGVLSTAYAPGRYSTQEQRIADFGNWYMRRSAAYF